VAFTGTLRGFQEEAYERMVERKRVLVGYEMGLGKTVLSIATIEHLIEQGEVGAGLIIVPSSLKYQWKRSIAQFTDGAISLVIDGTPKQREAQYHEAIEGGVEYTILNYEQVLNDWPQVRHLPRDFIVLDEATAIKNFAAKRTKRIQKLTSEYRYALTGQPVENKAEEVFSIMRWVDPDVLGSYETFDRTFIVRNSFGGVQRYRSLPLLHRTLSEAMVRKTRMDPDVRDQMPDVTEEVVSIDFDVKGARLYRKIAADLAQQLAKAQGTFSSFDLFAHYHGGKSAAEAKAQGEIMSRLTCLRMLCDHPDLLSISAAHYEASQVPSTGVKGGSVYAHSLEAEGALTGLSRHPKLDATVDLLKELLEANPANKIVLFAFFKDALRLIQEATAGLSKSVLFTGDMSPLEKDAAKQQFQDDPEVRLFLSSDAGGYGVDLPNANYLISYDLPWSAGKLDQRNARIIRLSSEFDKVTLIYMLMAGSIEERQFDMLEQKRSIASAVVDGKGIDKQGNLDLNLATLTAFLQTSSV
jgi:SNF2 family DNA or RNA helicase